MTSLRATVSRSRLHKDNKMYRQCIPEGAGSSGETAQYLFAYLRAHQPLLIILENVYSLLQEHQRDNLEAFHALLFSYSLCIARTRTL